MLYLDPTKRHDFVYLFDVSYGNPNGNPDMGNLPRIDPETNHGFVTDVALKRKIRDYAVMLYNKEIYIQSKSALNTLYYNAMTEEGLESPEVKVDDAEFLDWLLAEADTVFEIDEENQIVKYTQEFNVAKDIKEKLEEDIEVSNLEKGTKDKLNKLIKDLLAKKKGLKKLTQKDRDKVKENMIRRYYDIKMFGAVLTAGTNAGQVRGPVQFTFAKSISPILHIDNSITRVAITRESDKRRKQTEMGRKPIIPYGLYRAHGFYNPKLAERLTENGNPLMEDDLKILWDALQNMFDYNWSAASGERACRGLYIFSHNTENGWGNAPAHKCFESVVVSENEGVISPRSFSEYTVSSIDGKKIPKGVELNILGTDDEVKKFIGAKDVS